MKTDLGIIDRQGSVRGVGEFEEVLKHSFEIAPIGKLRILDIDTLIKAQETTGRPHDLNTVQHLKEVKSTESDDSLNDGQT